MEFKTREGLGVQSSDRQRLPRLAFASLTSGFGELSRRLPWNQPPASSSGSGQIEPKTGTHFEQRFCQRGNAHCGELAGVGVRSKRIAGVKNINVYAVGLYVDQSAARSALRTYRNKPQESLAKDQSFFDDLAKAQNVEKTLHMSISFGHISGSQFWDALGGVLAPRMKKAGADSALQEFARVFDDVKFRKGLPLSFCISRDSLTSKIDGKEVGTVKSRALCESLLDVYLGAEPVSADAKGNIGSGLASMIAGT